MAQIHFTSKQAAQRAIVFASAADRNKEPIGAVLNTHIELLKQKFGEHLSALEVASGTGQHLEYFTNLFPSVIWQPTELNTDCFSSIEGRRYVGELKQVKPVKRLDVANSSEWQDAAPQKVHLVLVANLCHISPWECTEGLFRGASSVLVSGGLLQIYGPFGEGGVISPQSNIDFDVYLKRKDPRWGVRDLNDIKKVASASQLSFKEKIPMPANNFVLLFEKI